MSEAQAKLKPLRGVLTGLENLELPSLPRRLGVVLAIALCLAVAAYPLYDSTTFGMSRIELTLFYLMAAIALNFVHGFGGVLMIGQPALMTAAGYAAGVLSVQKGWGIWATIPIAILVSVLLSMFMCSPSLRVQGWYLAVLSFMGVALVPDVVNAFYTTTGGTDGLPGIDSINIGGTEPPRWLIYEITLLVTIVCFVAARNLIKSGWGTSLLALRDHPYMATATGVNRVHVRAVLFALTGIPCGIAGALYAHSQQFFSAGTFGPTLVLLLIGGVLLGGRGTLWGPVFGVAIFSVISLWLGPFSLWNPFILGVGVLTGALVFRLGIVGTVLQFWGKHGPQKAVSERLFAEEVASSTSIEPVSEKPALEIHDLSKHFGGTFALSGVSLSVSGGKIVTVMGANGSGKTTLLNCISGFVLPDSGSITLNDVDVSRLRIHRRAHSGIARTFQVPRLVDELTVLENVALGVFGLEPQTVSAALFRTRKFRRRETEAAEKALAACRALGLSDRAVNAKASELTLALRRMVEIARALAADATVICLDEPVAGLNAAAQERVASVLRDLAHSGRAVMLIEHNLPFVLSISDELLLLRDGQVEDRGGPVDAAEPGRALGRYFLTFVAKADQTKVQLAIDAALAKQSRDPDALQR